MDPTTADMMDSENFHSASPIESGNENDQDTEMAEPPQNKTVSGNGKSAAANAKDPNRPRRKKARRACYACQRAHLTCGDERPCQRCIKRGLADVCQDGVRKKAKYLHDAPNEALLPGAANHYDHGSLKRQNSGPHPDVQTPFFGPTPNYALFTNASSQMPPPQMHDRSMSFSQQSAPAGFSVPPPLPSPTVSRHNTMPLPSTSWENTLFGAEDPALFNFDLASMNFGNHYGALEFGMLGKMATGAGGTPESETGTTRGSLPGQYPMPFGSISESPQIYENPMMDWNNNAMFNMPRKQEAFTIETAQHFTSPEATNHTPENLKNEDSPLLSVPISRSNTATLQAPGQTLGLYGQPNQPPPANFLPSDPSLKAPAAISTPQLKAKSQLPSKTTKRPRDPTSIYNNVSSPYPYTSGFHSLIAYLQKRFAASPSKTLTIAKSLASIRPSFIATTKTLNREDLIFMEKCFQRTLWEYEGFIEGVGTPTIVARRTGEIAAVGKEFQILTGWKKNVLLGREPNLNVNKGHSASAGPGSGANTTGRVTGTSTPALRHAETDADNSRPQPVFLAELLDDESVVQFYEDFARLAFGDSRGSVMGKGKLLKYRTKEDEVAMNLRAEADSQAQGNRRDGAGGLPSPEVQRYDLKRTDSFAQQRPQDAKKGISGEKGMQKLGASDGKVDCAYCWTVKRDVFDIPMLIVMNFLPCI